MTAAPVSVELTTAEVAASFRCSERKVLETARRLGVGANFGGRAGFRFTPEEVQKMRDSMRPPAPEARRRPRRRGATP